MAVKEQLDCCERQVLAEAALGGHAGAARLLLAVGANPDQRSETQGATPLGAAHTAIDASTGFRLTLHCRKEAPAKAINRWESLCAACFPCADVAPVLGVAAGCRAGSLRFCQNSRRLLVYVCV
jgi:hypothetical protein